MIVKGVFASDDRRSDGVIFSQNALDEMAKQATGLPVTINFSHGSAIGVVTESSRLENSVEVAMQISNERAIEFVNTLMKNWSSLNFAPDGYLEDYHIENGCLIIDRMTIAEISLITMPSKINLAIPKNGKD